MSARRALTATFYSAFLLGVAWGCSAADNSSSPGFSGSGANGNPEAGADASVVNPDGPATDNDGLALNILCGKARTCIPEDLTACAGYAPPVVPSKDSGIGQAGATASSAEGGEGGEAGANSSVVPSAGAAGEGGAAGEAGAAGAAGGGGAAGDAGAANPSASTFGCQVVRADGSPKSVVSECRIAGQGGVNAPCLSASDCQAGFGCVGDQSAGLCQQYCCRGADNCKPGTYCAERPMRDAMTNTLIKGSSDTSSALNIPVCVPAENCDLGAPYPCTRGTQCACASGTACSVVRSDGTTTCAIPGVGKVGEACPCAWGHVCSAATNQCLKLCYTRGAASCARGKCQSATELPDGWGVCVGG